MTLISSLLLHLSRLKHAYTMFRSSYGQKRRCKEGRERRREGIVILYSLRCYNRSERGSRYPSHWFD
jgi:hypothetical protein